jgi:3-dehydroquinate dehydratase-2
MKLLIINGPNLNLLGKREKSHYGELSLEAVEKLLQKEFPGVEFSFFQSNIEGEIISVIQSASEKYEGVIINPGGYAHTSVAIRDALEGCRLPKIEVHLSHLVQREPFRQNLITAATCNGYISGFRENSYLAAVFLMSHLVKRN